MAIFFAISVTKRRELDSVYIKHKEDNMLHYTLAILAGAVTTFMVNTLLAMFVIGPFFNKALGVVRTMEQGLHWPAMLVGYLGLAAILAFLYPRLDLGGEHFLFKGAMVGLLLGLAVFTCGHLVIAGWSTIPAGPMLWSGLLDAAAVVVGGMAAGVVFRFMGATHGAL